VIKPLLLRRGLTVDLEKREEFLEQPVARKFERHNRAFEALEEVRSNEANDLLLPAFFPLVYLRVRPFVPGERVIHGQREQRARLGKGIFKHVEQPPIRFAD